MAEDESLAMFDSSLKKKKKKKVVAEPEPAKVASPQPVPVEPKVEEKKEQKPETSKAESREKAEEKDDKDDKDDKDESDDDKEDKDDDNEDDDDKENDDDDQIEGEEGAKPKGKPAWYGTDRDYTYTELVERIFGMLLENNPELAKSKRKPMKPPQVFREGTKKTVWANFQEICKLMNRQPDHVLSYALAELGTNGSIDGNHRLVIKGRFQPKQLETVMRHYISEYVSCRTCRSPDTSLKKENRLYFLQCLSCGSTRSVAAVKQGFVAQVGKRKKA